MVASQYLTESFLTVYQVRFQCKWHKPDGHLESPHTAACQTQQATSDFPAANFGPCKIFVNSVKSGKQGQRVTVYDQDVNSWIGYCQSETDLWLISSPD